MDTPIHSSVIPSSRPPPMSDEDFMDCLQTQRFEMVDTAKVIPTPWNPVDRARNVKNLSILVAARGQLDPVHVAKTTNGFILAEGNRRLAVALELHIPQLKACVYSVPKGRELSFVYRLYSDLNKPRATLKQAQALQGMIAGGPPIGSHVEAAYQQMSTIFSEAEMVSFRERGVSVSAFYTAQRCGKYIVGKRNVGTDTATYRALVYKTMYYILRNETAQAAIHRYIRKVMAPFSLSRAIEKNYTIPGVGMTPIEK